MGAPASRSGSRPTDGAASVSTKGFDPSRCDYSIGCVCRACSDLWDETEARTQADDDPYVDVCTNCGAYFEWHKGLVGQRCGKCSKL